MEIFQCSALCVMEAIYSVRTFVYVVNTLVNIFIAKYNLLSASTILICHFQKILNNFENFI